MPELPEVETVRRGLAPAMEGAMVDAVDAKRPDLRFPLPLDFTKQLAGRTVTQLGRRAKYLIIDFDQGPSLICHLGCRAHSGSRPTAISKRRDRSITSGPRQPRMTMSFST